MKCVDLFCGAGGFSAGAASAGLETALGVDVWDNALQVFRENHPGAAAWREELGKEPAAEFAARLVRHMGGRRFHLHGSPPCQSVSRLNTKARREGTHDSAEAVALTAWFLDVVRETAPASWSMEQVRAGVVARLLEERRVPHAVLDFAVAFGLPQTRRRVIAGPEWLVSEVAASRAAPVFPAAVLTGGLSLPDGALIQSAVNYTPVRPGGGLRRILPGEWAKRPDRDPAPTVTKSPHRLVVGGEFAGSLTPEQCMALQGFPRGYRMVRADTGRAASNRYLLVGNAVPPPVGAAVGRVVVGAEGSGSLLPIYLITD